NKPGKHSYDLQNVATHEAGHFFGLGENITDGDATMFITSARGETKKRDLAGDDEDGVRILYATAPAAQTGAGCALASPSATTHWGWLGVGAVALGALAALAARRTNRRRVAIGGATIAMAGLFGTFSTSAPARAPSGAAADERDADA